MSDSNGKYSARNPTIQSGRTIVRKIVALKKISARTIVGEKIVWRRMRNAKNKNNPPI